MKNKYLFLIGILVTLILTITGFKLINPQANKEGKLVGMLLMDSGQIIEEDEVTISSGEINIIEKPHVGKIAKKPDGESFLEFNFEPLGYMASIKIPNEGEEGPLAHTHTSLADGVFSDLHVSLNEGDDKEEVELRGNAYGKANENITVRPYALYQVDDNTIIASHENGILSELGGIEISFSEERKVIDTSNREKHEKFTINFSFKHIDISEEILLIEYDSEMNEIKREKIDVSKLGESYKTDNRTEFILLNNNFKNSENNLDNDEIIKIYTKPEEYIRVYKEKGDFYEPLDIKIDWE